MESKEENNSTVIKAIEKDLIGLKKYVDDPKNSIEDIREYVKEILEEDPFNFRDTHDCNECKYMRCVCNQTHWEPAEYACALEEDEDFEEGYFETHDRSYCKHFDYPDLYDDEY